MTSPIDLLTGGLQQASGLSLVTGGLLVLQDFGIGGPPGEDVVASRVDAQVLFDAVDLLDGDLDVVSGDLAVENGLASSILLSLFTDRRASEDELVRFGTDDARGWWGDLLAPVAGDESGSKLWLLQREMQTGETLARAKRYAEQALAWLLEDGIAAAVNVSAVYPRAGLIGITVEVVRLRSAARRFAFVWEV